MYCEALKKLSFCDYAIYGGVREEFSHTKGQRFFCRDYIAKKLLDEGLAKEVE